MATLQDLIDRAAGDPAFRAKLKADATAAAKAEGVDLGGASLVALEDAPNTVNLVLGVGTPDDPDIAKVVQRALSDEAFKKALIADPAGTIRRDFGVNLPTSLNLVVHEDTAAKKHIVLPIQESAEGELDDAALEAVAGGGFIRIRLPRWGGGGGGSSGGGSSGGGGGGCTGSQCGRVGVVSISTSNTC